MGEHTIIKNSGRTTMRDWSRYTSGEATKPVRIFGDVSHAIQRLSSDALGSTVLKLVNIVPGSRYRIERVADGSLATPAGNAEGVAASATVVLALDYYSAGSSNNDLRIKVRKSTTAPKYQPFETQAQLSATPQTAYVAQVPDEIA